MINVEAIGLDQIMKTITTMDETIADFGKTKMAPELTAWEREDMHRKFPNTSQDNDTTVSTEIWPRSRLSKAQRPKGVKPVKVYAKPRAAYGSLVGTTGAHGGGVAPHSTRPILREELWEKLCERMGKLMSDLLVWKR